MTRKPPRRKTTRKSTRKSTGRRRAAAQSSVEVREIESMRRELERVARSSGPPRWNANPEDVRRSVIKLVLTLVDFIRQLLERQAVRRMDAGTLTERRDRSHWHRADEARSRPYTSWRRNSTCRRRTSTSIWARSAS